MQVEEEPAALTLLLKERQESPRERWTREPEKDQALLALARPTLQRRKRETSSHIKIEEREWESSPEHEEPHSHSISPVKGKTKDVSGRKKYETSPERNLKGMSSSDVEKPKASASRMVCIIDQGLVVEMHGIGLTQYRFIFVLLSVSQECLNGVFPCGPAQILQLKGKGQRSPSTVEEMRAQLDRDMAAAHEEEKRCIQFCALSSSHHSAYELVEVCSNHFMACLQV